MTEAKKNDISYGIGQSTVQAHASINLNKNKYNKRTYDNADLNEDEMYCIVSTGMFMKQNFKILKWEECEYTNSFDTPNTRRRMGNNKGCSKT